MSKRRRKGSAPQGRSNRLPLLLATAGAILIVAAIWATTGRDNRDVLPAASGAPRVVIPQDKVDYGDVKLNTPIEISFTVQNIGDRPLEILGEPQVEVVEGC